MSGLAKTDPNAPGLLSVERARAWLAEAVAIDEVKSLRDKAEAIAAYQRKQKAGREAAVDADLVVVFAERKIGELSRELPTNPGGRPKRGETMAKMANVSNKGKALRAQGIKCRSASRYEAAAAKGKRVTMRRILEPKRREARDAELVAQAKPVHNERGARCSVLLADPPWRYEHCEDEDGRSIEKQYPTLTLDKICAWDIDAICTHDAVLFLWVTSPKLAEGMRVLDAWGFTYRTCMVWVKDRIGMGYYARQRHELLLIGTKGSVAVPAPGDRPNSVIEAPRGKHSAKPTIAYEIIERMYPRLAKGELFARSKREEWLSWGYEA
jgi:N6-adenosine-specific RNA methylase IME4